MLLTYAIGLYFTLRTHADRIYPTKKHKKKRQEPISPTQRPLSEPNLNPIPWNPDGTPNECVGKGKTKAQSTMQAGLGIRRRKQPPTMSRGGAILDEDRSDQSGDEEEHNEHGNPGWSIFKSSFVLLACTVLYTMIAEILIDCLDSILKIFPMSEKTIGLTVFAIVPTVTEFCI